MSNSWLGKIVIGVVIGVIVNTIVSALNPDSGSDRSPNSSSTPSPNSFPNSSPVSSPTTRAYCFDFAARPRCPLLIPLPPGTPCFCPYQGTGYTGYL